MATNPRRNSSSSAGLSAVARLRKAKAVLLAVSLTFAGVLLIMLSGWLAKLNLGEERD